MKGQILLIDDNKIDIKVATSAIEKLGYSCHGFSEHSDVVDWLAENQPRLIFLDLLMPGVSGYELIPILKKHPKLKRTPIIIMSGKNQSEDVVKAIKLGATDYIVKPIDALIAQEKVERLCSQSADEYQTAEFTSDEPIEGFLSRRIRILSFSEFGVRIVSDSRLLPGEVIELTGAPEAIFGQANLLVRCLSCDVIPDSGGKYSVQMTFVGMIEAQRQIIRKSCLQTWIRTRKDVA